MSHFTTIQTPVRDLDAMREACAELGLELIANATCRGHAGVTRKAAPVIRLKGWPRVRTGAFGEAAKAYGLPVPKGLLIVGIPDTGKA